MTLYLGVDGGGTGCRAAVCDKAGKILGRGEGGPANIWTDPARARANILTAAENALAQIGGSTDPRAITAVLGIAGANAAGAAGTLETGLPFGQTRVVSDAMIALKGALGAADGVMAALGTGSVFGVQRAGAIEIIGGWGFMLGDQASGAWMGRALLETALLSHDGLAEPSPLLAEVIADSGGPAALVARARDFRPVEFAGYMPRVVAAASAGDAGAETVLARADAAVSATVDRLRARDVLPVTFIGGLGPVFADRLAGRWPILAPTGSPLDGALAMARGLV